MSAELASKPNNHRVTSVVKVVTARSVANVASMAFPFNTIGKYSSPSLPTRVGTESYLADQYTTLLGQCSGEYKLNFRLAMSISMSKFANIFIPTDPITFAAT